MTDKEIIVALAEKVCGWKRTYEWHSDDGQKHLIEFEDKHTIDWGWNIPRIGAWNPIESISDAWMVVEAMWERGWDGDVEWYRANHAPGFADGQRMYRGRFAAMADQERSELAFADSAPRAICLAALKAVGVPA